MKAHAAAILLIAITGFFVALLGLFFVLSMAQHMPNEFSCLKSSASAISQAQKDRAYLETLPCTARVERQRQILRVLLMMIGLVAVQHFLYAIGTIYALRTENFVAMERLFLLARIPVLTPGLFAAVPFGILGLKALRKSMDNAGNP